MCLSRFVEPIDVFGCFRRMVSLVILGAVAVAAYVTRDRWEPRLRAAFGSPKAGGSAAAPGDSTSPVRAADTGWTALSYNAAERGRRSITQMRARKGAAYVALSASEFAGAFLDSLTAQLPASAESLQVRAEGNEFQVRASVRLGDVGGRAVLGPLAAMLGDRERLMLGGTLEPTGVAGMAQFKLTRIKVGDFTVPSPVVPRLLKALKRSPPAPGVDVSALPVRLPAGIGDIRVAQGKVTLYRITP